MEHVLYCDGSLKGNFTLLPNSKAVIFLLKPQRIQSKIKGMRIFIFFPPLSVCCRKVLRKLFGDTRIPPPASEKVINNFPAQALCSI